MKFAEKTLSQLKDYYNVVVSMDFEFWIGLGMDTFGVYELRIGQVHNYLQFLLEIPLGRQRKKAEGAYDQILKKLLYIAEHNEKPLHDLLPDNRHHRSNDRMMAAIEILNTEVAHREKLKRKSVKLGDKSILLIKAQNLSGNGIHKVEVEEMEMKDSAERHLSETLASEQEFPTINEIVPEPAAPEIPLHQESEDNGAAGSVDQDGDDDSQLYKRRREISQDDFTVLLLELAVAGGNIRTEYAHLPYDLLLEVDIPRSEFKKNLARAPIPRFTLWLGRFFRMYPATLNDYRKVLTGSREREGKKETYFIFDNEQLAKIHPDSTFSLPISGKNRTWKPTINNLGYAILEALGTRPQSLSGSKKIWRIKLEPMNVKDKGGSDIPVQDTRNFIVEDVDTFFFADGEVPKERWREIIGMEVREGVEEKESENQ